MSELQLKKLFSKLADSVHGDITVVKFIRNIAGSDTDTVDGQKDMCKLLYNEIYRRNKHKELE